MSSTSQTSASTSAVWKERLRSPLTWHIAGFVLLLALTAGLGIRLGLDWAATNSSSADALAGKQIQLKALEMATGPLRGIDKRVEESRGQIKAFYDKRIPPSYSQIAGRIGDLAVASQVRLSRVQYTQGKPGDDLTEITLDASISGQYPAIMRFVNGVERDQTFFVIRTMSLNGQQGGLVNLRIGISTWLRPADVPSGLPMTPQAGEAASSQASKEGE